MLTYADFYQILIEAEERRDDKDLPADVRFWSGIAAELCVERMRRDGLTRERLIELARSR